MSTAVKFKLNLDVPLLHNVLIESCAWDFELINVKLCTREIDNVHAHEVVYASVKHHNYTGDELHLHRRCAVVCRCVEGMM